MLGTTCRQPDHEEGNRVIPGISRLLEDLKALEDHARAYRSRGELRMVLVTEEEADVVDSFRRFMAQEY
jgi:hypothetical protein